MKTDKKDYGSLQKVLTEDSVYTHAFIEIISNNRALSTANYLVPMIADMFPYVIFIERTLVHSLQNKSLTEEKTA
jgi:hypothetical protein